MKYENILFDLYGTLMDIRTDESMPLLWRVMADYFKLNGAAYSPEELKKSFYGLINEQVDGKDDAFEADLFKVFTSLYTNKNVVADFETVVETAKNFRKTSTLFLQLYPGVKSGLETLKKCGKKIFLLSNAQQCFTMPELEMSGIKDLFDGIFISSEYGVKKPSEKFFNIPFEKFGLDKQKTIMVGNDGFSDILGGRNVGIDTLYIRTEISPEEEIPPATYIFLKHDFAKILKILTL